MATTLKLSDISASVPDVAAGKLTGVQPPSPLTTKVSVRRRETLAGEKLPIGAAKQGPEVRTEKEKNTTVKQKRGTNTGNSTANAIGNAAAKIGVALIERYNMPTGIEGITVGQIGGFDATAALAVMADGGFVKKRET